MNNTTNTSQAPERQGQNITRPVIETIEAHRSRILNTLTSNTGSNRRNQDACHAFINALQSQLVLPLNNPVFQQLLRDMGVPDINQTMGTLRNDFVQNNAGHVLSIGDLQQRQEIQFIIAALANFNRYEQQTEQNNFDAIYLGQTGETESSTAQQIEAAAQRARLTGGALYYRNKIPLRITWNNNQYEAQYLDLNGQPSNLQGIQTPDIPTLVTEINARSQRIHKISSDNVQQNVELREAKKADHKQIIAAIDFINRGQTAIEREARTGFYSVDNRNFAIRGQGPGEFSVDIMETNGTVTTRDNIRQNAVTSLIDTACNAYEKSKDRKETIETPDMGTQFSEAIFRKLCRDISDSKDKVGEYQLSGQKYTVREVTAAIAPALARYFAQYPNPQGRTVGFPNPVGTGEEIVNITAHIAQNTRTSTNQGNCTRDMGNEFSANIFRELCEEIGESKNGRGTYTLAGKKYEIRVDQPLPVDVNAAIFHAEHPNQFGIKVLAAGATIDALLDQQNHGALSHIHVHDPSKPAPFERERMLELCRLANQTNERQEFDFHGKSCFVYKPTGLDSTRSRYCIDIPNNKGGVDTIKAMTQKGLYEKFINHADRLHHGASDKGSEGNSEKKQESTHEDKGSGHDEGEEHHEKGKKSLYDKAVTGFFGNGLLGKALIWPKNQIPKPLRSLGGNVVGAGVTSGVVGGVLAGTAWVVGSAALSSAVVPAMGVTFTASMVNRFLKWRKWWPHNKKEDGEDEHGHGGHQK